MPLIGRWCGTNKPKTITSSNSQVLIVFKTDDLVDMKGFHIKFNSKNKNLLPKKNSDTDESSTITWWIEEISFSVFVCDKWNANLCILGVSTTHTPVIKKESKTISGQKKVDSLVRMFPSKSSKYSSGKFGGVDDSTLTTKYKKPSLRHRC